MMTPNRGVQKQHGPQRHPLSPLPTWQRLVLGGYSALLALRFPLICWGAVAEPGHPHRLPKMGVGEMRLPLGMGRNSPQAVLSLDVVPTTTDYAIGI